VGLSAWTAYLAIRRYVPSRVAAALGGLVYGFSPYMRAHSAGHVNLMLVFLPPVLLLLLDNIVVRQRRTPLRDGALLGLVAACQLLINEEVLGTTALAGALLVVVLAAGHRHQVRSHLPYAARAMAVAGLVFLVVAAVPLASQFFGPYRYSGPPGTGHLRFVNDLASFVVPGQPQLLTTAALVRLSNSLPGNLAERTGYLGAPLLLLALGVAVRWWSRPVVRAAALLALFMAVLSMGAHLSVGGHRTTIPLPWSVLDGLPLVEGVIPARLSVLTTLFVGLLLAVFADAVVSWSGWQRLLGAVVVLLALAPIVPRYTNSAIGPVDPPRFFTGDEIDRIPVGSVALVLPFPDRSASFPMMWHAMGGMRFKMPGGYFLGPDREGHAKFGPLPSATRQVAGLLRTGRSTPERVQRRYCSAVEDELRSWGVQTVLIGPMPHQAEAASFFSGLLGRAPEEIGDMLVWQDVEAGGHCP